MCQSRAIYVILLFAAGCGPAVSPKELGRVVYEIPAVPGAEEPYPVPEFEATAAETGEQDEGQQPQN